MLLQSRIEATEVRGVRKSAQNKPEIRCLLDGPGLGEQQTKTMAWLQRKFLV